MDLRISLTDGVPIYQQIATQVRYLIAAGSLKPGVEMPPIRVLAERLQVNPNTVARAYRELEQEGTVEKRSTKGTFVSDSGSKMATRYRQAALHDRIDQLLAESTQLGFSVDQLIKEIHNRSRVMKRMQESSSDSKAKKGKSA